MVANGEIACRIIRTLDRRDRIDRSVPTSTATRCTVTSLPTVAVPLGAVGAGGYRSIDRLLAIAADHDADGVHPGYRFLAEDADFAQAVGTQDGRSSGRRPTSSASSAPRTKPAAPPPLVCPSSGTDVHVGASRRRRGRSRRLPLLVRAWPVAEGSGCWPATTRPPARRSSGPLRQAQRVRQRGLPRTAGREGPPRRCRYSATSRAGS
jgi:hypothetical protein